MAPWLALLCKRLLNPRCARSRNLIARAELWAVLLNAQTLEFCQGSYGCSWSQRETWTSLLLPGASAQFKPTSRARSISSKLFRKEQVRMEKVQWHRTWCCLSGSSQQKPQGGGNLLCCAFHSALEAGEVLLRKLWRFGGREITARRCNLTWLLPCNGSHSYPSGKKWREMCRTGLKDRLSACPAHLEPGEPSVSVASVSFVLGGFWRWKRESEGMTKMERPALVLGHSVSKSTL